MSTPLSEHFTLEQLCVTDQKGVDNTPNATQVQSLKRLATEVLEPIYSAVGPFTVISAFRSPALNAKLAGVNSQVSSTSYHMQGWAADIVPVGSKSAANFMADIIRSGVPYGELYLKNTAIHISLPTDAKRSVAGKVVNNQYIKFSAEDLKKFLAENAGTVAGIGGIVAVGALGYFIYKGGIV